MHHIGGLQQVVRAIASDAHVLCADWKSVEHGSFPEVGENWTISLVPSTGMFSGREIGRAAVDGVVGVVACGHARSIRTLNIPAYMNGATSRK